MTTVLTRQCGKIAEWLGAVLAADQVVEVRCLQPFASAVFRLGEADGLARLAEFAAEHSGRHKGIYFTPNPLREPLGGKHNTAVDGDVLSRDWLLVDADPVRPKDTNATPTERTAAAAVIRSVRDTLAARGFAGMVVGDSGNGAHLMVPVRMANDGAGKVAHQQLLRHLAERFGTAAVTIDKSTFNAARIWKLPATLAMKGPHSEDRPSRYARLVDVPENPRQYAERNAAALGEMLAAWNMGRPWAKALEAPHADGRLAVIRRAMAYLAKEPPAVQGQNGSGRCYHVAGVCYDGFALSVEESLTAMGEWNARCVPPWSENELRHKLESVAAKGGARGGLLGGSAGSSATGDSGDQSAPSGPLTIRASGVTPRKVQWLWPWRIPLGKLTTFAGVGGVGKTFALLDIAARVSRGSEWPGCDGECAEPGQVLFISGEDDPDDTMVPRLIELGADLDKISFLRSEIADRFTLADLPLLDRAIAEVGDGLRFLAIDPPTAFLGGVNDHKNAELRGLLSPLKTLAQRHNLACVFNTHVTKPQGAKVEAVMRIMGSVAWVNAVRAAHIFARDPEDQERRIFALVKSNLGPEQKALAYRLVTTDDLARIEWLGLVDLTADEAMNSGPQVARKRSVEAATWVEELFVNRSEIPSKEVWDARKKTTVSENALKEAKEEMGIRARRALDGDGQQQWFWYWPVEAKEQWFRSKPATFE